MTKIKLGKKANSFFDPTTKLKVLPGQVIELKNIHKKSTRITKALRDGHLQYTDEDVNQEAPKSSVKEKETENWIEKLELTTEALSKLKKAELIEVAKFYESQLEDSELQEYTKAELIEEIFELSEGSGEEDDE